MGLYLSGCFLWVYARRWAYTRGGLYTGVSEALELSSKMADLHLFSQIFEYFNDFLMIWAYTRGGLYTGVSEALELWLICSFFSQIIMYFNDFWASWAYTRGAYIRVLKSRSDSGRF